MATRAKPEPDTRVQANPFLARQLAAGCNRYAELLVRAAEDAAKSPSTYDQANDTYVDGAPATTAMDLESTRELADVFRQHARELLEPYRIHVAE